jgi:putative flippase GtrA
VIIKSLSFLNRNFYKLLRFGMVGLLGTVVNFIAYYFLVIGININIAAILSFFVAVVSNYILNHKFTFRIENLNRPLSLKCFFQYLSGNILGLIINLTVLNSLIYIYGINFHIKAQIIGIMLGSIFNFIFVNNVVFPSK